jgi:hypothetical protein
MARDPAPLLEVLVELDMDTLPQSTRHPSVAPFSKSKRICGDCGGVDVGAGVG